MIKRVLILLSVILLVIGIASCDTTDSPTENSCSLSAEPLNDANGYLVTYKAEKTGDGVMTKLTYVDNTGTITVENPELPWQKTFTFSNENQNAKMTAEGKTTNGSLRIEIFGTVGVGNFTASDDCSSSSN